MTRRFILLAVATLPLFAADPVIVLVGDSTVNDQGGWGPGFRAALPQGTIVNLAQNGRSSKSFRDEGRWDPALTRHATHILIQFGHNDQPGKGPDRETDAATTYRANLARYVDEARAAGAVPVLVTSIVRRNFTPEGKIVADSLVPYVEATRAVAAEKNVPLIDLYSATSARRNPLVPTAAPRSTLATPKANATTPTSARRAAKPSAPLPRVSF